MDDFKVVSALEMCVALNWNWLSMFHSSECAPVQALSAGGSPMPKIGRPIQKPSRKGLGHMRFFSATCLSLSCEWRRGDVFDWNEIVLGG